MKKLHCAFLLLTALVAGGLSSCSSEDSKSNDEQQVIATTHVGLTISLPKEVSANTRAAGDATELPQNHNTNGTWDGRDVIKSITIYMVGEKSVVKTLYKDNLSIDKDGRIWPVITAKSEEGNVRAFVVINDTEKKLGENLDKLLTSSKDFMVALDTEVSALALDLANSTDGKDVIVMTNTVIPVAKPIEANVNETAARNGKNKISVAVERITSRGIVTMNSSALTKVIDVKNSRGEAISKIKIEKVSYGVGQSNKAVYPIKKSDYKTPGYNDATSLVWSESKDKFDNKGLADQLELQTIASKSEVLTALEAEQSAKYVLPLVHGKYLKGNTTYFEVRAKFEVVGNLADTGKAQTAEQKNVYLGMQDGKFYANRDIALGMGTAISQEDLAKGEFKQKVYTYVNNEMVYVMWLNPDNIPGSTVKAVESPVVRNQVYHAHITGFKEIGVPYNPLNPTDPSKPIVPIDPTDPTKPTDPTEPVNPIDPTDPLQNEDTYLSVEIGVVDWGVHSYEFEAGNNY